MPRVYAYAKERQVDSKEVVDLCLKLGILNKGSALAPLEEDEVAKLNQYLDRGSGTSRADILVASPLQSFQKVQKLQSTPKAPVHPIQASAPVLPFVRIYSLAKRLKIDSKELVDALEMAGVKGKGSALAAIDENDFSKLKEYLKIQIVFRDVLPSATSPHANLPPIALAEDSRDVDTVEVNTIMPMCLSNALAIDSLHVQVTEVGAIVETLLLKVLDSSASYRGEERFCNLIDDAFNGDVFSSLSADELHAARINRNKVVHRSNGLPSQAALRQTRNIFVLAVLDLLEHCSESLKAEVLSEFIQYLPQSKRLVKPR